MKQIRIHEWTGQYLAQTFLVARPANSEYSLGSVVEVHEWSGTFLGYAKVVEKSSFRFELLNNTMAYLMIGKPAAYLKATLNKMLPQQLDNGRPVDLLVLSWTERNLDHMKLAMELHWERIIKSTPHAADRQMALNLAF